jgi:hypothetical protein
MKLALAPAIVNLLRRGEYAEAGKKLMKALAPTEAAEAIKYAGEKLGLKSLEKLGGWIAAHGAEADALFAIAIWEWDGIMAVPAAREAGDADSRIRMYARAFTDSFLEGERAEGGRAGAVTAAQKEAVELGLRDGSRTAGTFGEGAASIGRELMRRCGSEVAARRLIMDEPLKRAGLPGVGN